jgi:subtilisin family serine protease
MVDNSLYQNSSRGYTFDNRVKPDIVAPAVDIKTLNKRGDVVNVTGTSVAAAIVTAVVAMLYEWADYVI